MNTYRVSEDLATVKMLTRSTTSDLARELKVGTATLERWIAQTVTPQQSKIEQFYEYACREGIDLNRIKAQLYRELADEQRFTLLFHGAKTSLEGPLSIERSRPNNDFGQGFYCGQSLAQSATFVAGYKNSSLYMLAFESDGLISRTFVVNQDWMLAIAWFRGWLKEYADHPRIASIRASVQEADYVVAPIADNRMYEVINNFIDGQITDVQCQHCLAATDLGSQYVFTTSKSLAAVHILERCYLSGSQKKTLLSRKTQDNHIGVQKAKVALRQFRREGYYIEEVLA